MPLKTGKMIIERPNPVRCVTNPRRPAIVIELGKEVSLGPNITDRAQLLARELCILSGGNPDEIVPVGHLKGKLTSGAITCLPALPIGWIGFPMWMLLAAEARWGAKASREAGVVNRSKKHK